MKATNPPTARIFRYKLEGRIPGIELAGAAGFEPANAGTKNRTEPTEGRRNSRPIKSLAD